MSAHQLFNGILADHARANSVAAQFGAAREATRSLPSESLRSIAARAVEADEAFANTKTHDDDEFRELEQAQFETREALYAALAGLGIERSLADKLGRILW